MDNKITAAAESRPTEYQAAVELHAQIMQSGKLAASAMVEFARGLKRMRDERLYLALGLESFDQYADEVVGIGKRQAYTYIRGLEQLGPRMMEEHASLGITKLEILTQVYALDREEFLAEHNVEDMSAREMRELVAKLKDTGEQLEFVVAENDRLKNELEEAKNEPVVADVAGTIEAQAAKIEELEKRLGDADAARVTAVAAAEKAARKAAANAEREKIKDEIAKAEAAKKEALQRLESAKAEADERVRQITAATEAEQAAQLQRAKELEQQLKIAANPDTTAVAVYVDELQGLLGKAVARIRAVREKDGETGAKLGAAMIKVLDAAKPQIEEALR